MAPAAPEDVDALLKPPPEPQSFIGSVVGHRYRVQRLIGRGGMGAVFEAEHTELGTPIALKVLIAERGLDAEDVERFLREARAAVQIGHRNIVRVFDLGRMDDGTPYMAMERLEGRDLDQLLVAEGSRSLEEALAILEPIASAIDAVHAEGLVHRDIKPANIFLAEEKEEVVPKLLDFGLAQLRDLEAQERLTGTGIIVGTPHYLAPEVGTGSDPSERSDQYSLAVIAYELLSGEIPFDGTNPTSIMVAKVGEDPPRLPGPWGADDRVWSVLSRALARPPSERFESCTAFIAALSDAARADAPQGDVRATAEPSAVAAPALDPVPAPDAEPPELPSRGPAGRWILGAALLLALVGLVVWAPWDGPGESTEPEPSSAESTEPETPTDVAPADDTPTARAETPAANPSTPTPVGESPTPMAATAMSETATMATMTETATTATMAATMATEAATATMATAETTMTETAAMTETPTMENEPGRSPERAGELTRQGQRALLRGQLAQAARLFREATYSDSRHAPAWRSLGIAHERMGHAPEARRAYRRYLQLAPGAGDASAIRQRMNAL